MLILQIFALSFLLLSILALLHFMKKVRQDQAHWRHFGSSVNLIGIWLILFSNDALGLKATAPVSLILGLLGAFLMIAGAVFGNRQYKKYSSRA